MRICHFSSAVRDLDARSFYREAVPAATRGLEVSYIGPHGRSGLVNGVELLACAWRTPRALRFAATPLLLRMLLREQANLYQFHNPELIPVGLVLKLVFGKRVIYDIWEDYPSMMMNKTYLPRFLRSAARAIVVFAETMAAKFLDGLVTADPFTLRRLARVAGSRKLVFLNFPNMEYFPSSPSEAARFDFVYRGGLSERAGIGLIIDAMKELVRRGRKPRVLLVGYADSDVSLAVVAEAIKKADLAGLIELRGRIPHEEMARTLSQARAGLCPLRPIPKFLLNIPVKVWEYWACGLPAIATNLPPIRPFFRDREYGVLVPPDDAHALAAACEWMMDHPSEARQMGLNGMRAVQERLNNVGQVNQLMRFYQQLTEAPA